MAQLRLGYPEIQKRNAEALQITLSTVAEAAHYGQYYQMPFPYLCDPERVVFERYGLKLTDMSLGDGLQNFARSSVAVMTDLVLRGQRSFSPRPYLERYPGKDSPQAVYVIDRDGVIRRAFMSESLAAIPSNVELARALDALGAS